MISDITNKLFDAQSTIRARFILSLYIRYEHKLYRYIDAVAVTIILRLFPLIQEVLPVIKHTLTILKNE